MPNLHTEPHRAAAQPAVGPGPRVPRAVAERADRHRLQRGRDREVKSFEELLTRADLKGRITLLTEMRDTMGFMLKVVGADPERVHRRRVGTTPSTSSQVGGRRRPGPGVHRQRVHPGPRGREHRGLRGVVGRRDPGPVRQPRHQVRRRRRRGCRSGATTCWCPTSRAPGQRRGVDQLLLRARGRGEARRVGQLHLSGPGRPGGDGEDRPVAGRQPADLPRRRDARRRPWTSCRSTTQQITQYEGELADVTGG